MTRTPALAAGVALLTAVVGALVILAGFLPGDSAVSHDDASSSIDVRLQARQTVGGRVEVRAQSDRVGEWQIHAPDARFLPIEPEPGRWYSSDSFTVSASGAAVDRADAVAVTRATVEAAIARYDRDGRKATVEYYNTPASADGQWYVFIIDEQGDTIAHLNRELVGAPTAEVEGPGGYPVGRMTLAAAHPRGAWLDYPSTNPLSGQPELKHSWVVRHDGLIFGSGWYEDAPSKQHAPGAYTQSYVAGALEMYRVLGREATFEQYNASASIDGEWYLFIHNADGTRLVNGARADRPGWLGSNLRGSGEDVTGYDYVDDTLAIETSGWISYVFPNPDDELRYQHKHTWLVRHDGLIFGSGWYDRNYDLAAEHPAGYARALVQQAVDLHDSEGRQAALDYYNLPESSDGPWYVFILQDRDDGLYTVAHATRPELVGTTRERIDANGFDYGAAIAAVTEHGAGDRGGGEWVSYLFTHPETGEDAPKHSWIERRGDLIFGAGWYEGID